MKLEIVLAQVNIADPVFVTRARGVSAKSAIVYCLRVGSRPVYSRAHPIGGRTGTRTVTGTGTEIVIRVEGPSNGHAAWANNGQTVAAAAAGARGIRNLYAYKTALVIIPDPGISADTYFSSSSSSREARLDCSPR